MPGASNASQDVTNETCDADVQVLWELQSLRRAGYEPCIIVCSNRRGDLRYRTTLDSTEEVKGCLDHLLAHVDEASISIEGAVH